MGHDQHQPSSSSGAGMAIVAVLMLVATLALVVLGGAGLLLWVNTSSHQARAVAVAELNRAVVAEKRAEAERFRAIVESQSAATETQSSGMPATADKKPVLVVTVDRDGNAGIDGAKLGFEELRVRLTQFKAETSSAFSLEFRVARECPFEKLIPVFELCRELGGMHMRIVSTSDSASLPEKSNAVK